jgi:hypothetical protein
MPTLTGWGPIEGLSMSALGQKRTSLRVIKHVRFVPIRDELRRSKKPTRSQPHASRSPMNLPALDRRSTTTVCRMHGARGGAPQGKRNGNYKHGARTKEMIALRKVNQNPTLIGGSGVPSSGGRCFKFKAQFGTVLDRPFLFDIWGAMSSAAQYVLF